MDIIEAIKTRHSVRAFKPDPVPRGILEELLNVSLRSPSWANTQTWEFSVVGGQVMKELREALAARAFAQDDRTPAIAYPEWPTPYKERRRENGIRLYQALGIGREDEEKKLNWFVDMYRFFDAPNAIYIHTDEGLSEWAIMNVGIMAQTISLAALAYGLGTVMLAAGINYPFEVKRILKLPDSKQLWIAMGIGYPDTGAAVNRFRSNRAPLNEICTWHGL
jgi:nitroreductase